MSEVKDSFDYFFGTKDSYDYLRKIAIKINSACGQQNTNNYGLLAYGVLTKCLICSETLSNIIFPNPKLIVGLSIRPIILYDLPSAYVLIRSMFESYVNLYYVLVANETAEEKEFKFLLWQRHSRQERKRMAEYINKNSPILKKEEKEIELLNKRILLNNYYTNLPKKKQQFYSENNNWTNLNITNRAIKCGISKSNISFIYKFLPSYAHSESFSSTQFNSIKSPNQAKKLIEGFPLMFAEAFLCMICDLNKPYFQRAQEIIDNEPYLNQLVTFWKDYLKKEK
jgi:hypothetical protein